MPDIIWSERFKIIRINLLSHNNTDLVSFLIWPKWKNEEKAELLLVFCYMTFHIAEKIFISPY